MRSVVVVLTLVVALAGLTPLVVAQTRLTDAAVEHLRAMPALRRVHVWRSGISGAGIATLRAARPELVVETGDATTAAVLESEPPLDSGRTNTTCPVSGRPVDARYTIVHEGRAIAFCCAECARQFWADPAKFAPD